jgi:hypothetical protein
MSDGIAAAIKEGGRKKPKAATTFNSLPLSN